MSIRERSGKLLLIMALKTTFGFTHLHSVTGFLSPVCGDQRVRHDCSAPPGYVKSHSVKPFLFPTYTFMAPLHHMLSLLISPSIQQPPQIQLNHQILLNYHLPPFPSETKSPTPLSPTWISLRYCQKSHRLLPNCREGHHPPRRPMRFHSKMLAEEMHWMRNSVNNGKNLNDNN